MELNETPDGNVRGFFIEKMHLPPGLQNLKITLYSHFKRSTKTIKPVMKKTLLISAAILIGACVVNAQTTGRLLKPSIANKAFPILKNLSTDFQPVTGVASGPAVVKKNPATLASTLLGFTCYELQSNCSAPRQLIHHSDGTISFTWTIDDHCANGNNNRGSGYNYWNGSSMLVPGGVTARIETVRTGFSQIGILGNGKEIIFAHNGPPYDFTMSSNTAKGVNTWTGVNSGVTLSSGSVPGFTTGVANEYGLWGRIATGGSDGNSIHLISNYYPGATGVEGPVIKGILAPTVYSLSTDGGLSWDQQSTMLPGYDSTRTYNGGGEAYAIDAEGNNVAIVIGGVDSDVALWKSTDNGTTFTRTFVDQYAFAPSIDSTGATTDTAETSDGAVTVVLGPTGTAHVAYSTVRVTPGGFFPSDAGLIYWNDVAKVKVPINIALSDIDGPANGGNNTGAWEVGQFTTIGGTTPPSARYGNRAFLTIPSIAVDGNNIFILFSLVSDGDSTVDGQSFRDIWVVASADGGVTFGPIQNITCTVGEEEFFISLAKRVDANSLHFMYNLDTEPGTNIQNGDPIAASELRYSTIDKAKVLAGIASCQAGNSVNEQSTSVFNISDNYPNPVSGMTYFDVTMKQNASVSFNIVNNLGQQVYTTSAQRLTTGKHTLSVDASAFANGLYFYTITSGDAIVSGKMTVIK